MKKLIIVSLFFLATLAITSHTYGANIKLPADKIDISLSTGGYMFFEFKNGEYYLIDTRTGRLWQFIGDISSPDHFEPVKFEISKGALSVQPENETTNQFPGRFTFDNFRDKMSTGFFILDTVTGKMWRLQEASTGPLKLILIPRKD